MSRSSTATARKLSNDGESPKTQRKRTRRVAVQAVDSPRVWSLGLLGVFAFVALFGALLGSVVVQTGVVQYQVEKDQLGRDIAENSETQNRLSLEVAKLEAPQRILSEAQVRLGMVTPDNRPYLAAVVPDDPTTKVPLPGPNPFGASE